MPTPLAARSLISFATQSSSLPPQCLSNRVPSIRFRFQVNSYGEVDSGFSARRRLQAATQQPGDEALPCVSGFGARRHLQSQEETPRAKNCPWGFSSAHQRRLLDQAPSNSSNSSTAATATAATNTWGYPVQGTVDKASVTQVDILSGSSCELVL